MFGDFDINPRRLNVAVCVHAMHARSRQMVHPDLIELDIRRRPVVSVLLFALRVALDSQLECQHCETRRHDREYGSPRVEHVGGGFISHEDVADPVEGSSIRYGADVGRYVISRRRLLRRGVAEVRHVGFAA